MACESEWHVFWLAAGKLAGALGICEDREEWPPDALQASSVLVFLKKVRGYLRYARRVLDSLRQSLKSLNFPPGRICIGGWILGLNNLRRR